MTNPLPLDNGSEGAEDRDVETVRQLLAGNQEGLTRLVADHADVVRQRLRIDFGKTLDEHHLEDVLSQAAHRVWLSRAQFKSGSGSLRAWFLVIARNVARRMLRTPPTRVTLRSDMDRAIPRIPLSPGTGTGQQRELLLLYHCIRTLPPLQRDVVLADLAAGGTAPAGPLGQELGTTSNSIYASRAQARATLRIALRDLRGGIQPSPTSVEAVE